MSLLGILWIVGAGSVVLELILSFYLIGELSYRERGVYERLGKPTIFWTPTIGKFTYFVLFGRYETELSDAGLIKGLRWVRRFMICFMVCMVSYFVVLFSELSNFI